MCECACIRTLCVCGRAQVSLEYWIIINESVSSCRYIAWQREVQNEVASVGILIYSLGLRDKSLIQHITLLLCPKWHPIQRTTFNQSFSWWRVVQYIGNGVPFGTQTCLTAWLAPPPTHLTTVGRNREYRICFESRRERLNKCVGWMLGSPTRNTSLLLIYVALHLNQLLGLVSSHSCCILYCADRRATTVYNCEYQRGAFSKIFIQKLPW